MAGMSEEAKFYADEELVASTPSTKNWRGMIISIVVICSIIGLIVTAVIIISPKDQGPHQKGSRFTVEDIISGKYKVELFNGSWLRDNQILTTDANNNLQILDSASSTFQPLLINESLTVPQGAKFTLSSDNRYLLLSTGHKKRPGQPEEFEATVYDLTTGVVYPVPFASPDERITVQAAVWSPRSNALAYVSQNDVYFLSDVTDGQAKRLTTNGAFNAIYNGIADWTYQDIMKEYSVWFSTNGERLAYVTFNDTGIPEVRLPIYSEPDSFQLYTEQVFLRYPTPSSPIPKVSLQVIDLMDNASIKELRPPLSLRDHEYYLTLVKWVNDQRICAVWTLRAQNISIVSFCDAGPWHCQTVTTIESGVKRWLNQQSDVHFHPEDGNSFLHLAPVQVDHHNFYTNIIMVDASKRHSWSITQQSTEIQQILGWDVKRNIVYYVSSSDSRQSDRHIYKVHIKSQKASENSIECLTCPVRAVHLQTHLGGETIKDWSVQSIWNKDSHINSRHPYHFHADTTCRYSNAIMSPTMDYYVLECLGPAIPYVQVRTLPGNMLVRNLLTNAELDANSRTKIFPRRLKLRIPLAATTPWNSRHSQQIDVELFLPPSLREDENLKYPLVVLTSDEPDEEIITDEWKVDWSTYMASGRDIIVAKVHLHTTQNWGRTDKNYQQPGALESIDLIHIIKILQKTFPYISPSKTALIGAHYGGFLTINTLANDPTSVFGCGIAISPVSSWQSMAAPYAERYLGLLNGLDGQRRYFDADLNSCSKNLHNKHLLLLHGTLDETFLVTHSMLIARSLINNRVSFQQMMYPDMDYQTMKRNAHIFEIVNRFLNECFDRRDKSVAEYDKNTKETN